jgi:hypothetical protein
LDRVQPAGQLTLAVGVEEERVNDEEEDRAVLDRVLDGDALAGFQVLAKSRAFLVELSEVRRAQGVDDARPREVDG